MNRDEYGRIYFRKDVECKCPEGWDKQFHQSDCPRSVYAQDPSEPTVLTGAAADRLRRMLRQRKSE